MQCVRFCRSRLGSLFSMRASRADVESCLILSFVLLSVVARRGISELSAMHEPSPNIGNSLEVVRRAWSTTLELPSSILRTT